MIYVQFMLAMMAGVVFTHENGGIVTGLILLVAAVAVGKKGAFPDEIQ